MLAWIFDRCDGDAAARESQIGLLPLVGDGGIDTAGLDVSGADMEQLLAVDVQGWKQQIPQIRDHYAKFGATLPVELAEQLTALEQRLS